MRIQKIAEILFSKTISESQTKTFKIINILWTVSLFGWKIQNENKNQKQRKTFNMFYTAFSLYIKKMNSVASNHLHEINYKTLYGSGFTQRLYILGAKLTRIFNEKEYGEAFCSFPNENWLNSVEKASFVLTIFKIWYLRYLIDYEPTVGFLVLLNFFDYVELMLLFWYFQWKFHTMNNKWKQHHPKTHLAKQIHLNF